MQDSLFSVKDKIIIVTGGFGQLGAQYVRELHSRGALVAVLGSTCGEDKINKVFNDIRDSKNVRFYGVNITKVDEITNALDDIENVWGTPDGLINNAGIDTQPSAPPEVSGPFENFPEEVFREVVEVNLVGTFLMTQQVGARMKQAGKSG